MRISVVLPVQPGLGQENPVQKLQDQTYTMTGRQIEDEDESFPNKKICVETADKNTNEEIKKLKKKNVAILLAYCGCKYYGMQKNKNLKTIESELLDALVKTNSIPEKAVEDVQSLHFQRAARTDKGVSAAKQVVSLKLFDNYNVESLNSHLPEDIRVLSIKRVTKGFNSKSECLARTYSYTLPTFALSPELHEEYPENFRITQEMIQKTNEILNTFVGTHCFHNFTSRKDSKDPSSKRYIMSFQAGEPFIDSEEFITLTVKGQSFMLHQIRKMVGHTMALIKGIAPANYQADVWKMDKCFIPMAPGLGLVLENLHYDRYNRKYGQDGIHESLTWDEVADEVEKFKRKHITSKIIKKELEEKSMFEYIKKVFPFHNYKCREEKDLTEDVDEKPENEKVDNALRVDSQL